jgi:hypothetical protein
MNVVFVKAPSYKLNMTGQFIALEYKRIQNGILSLLMRKFFSSFLQKFYFEMHQNRKSIS